MKPGKKIKNKLAARIARWEAMHAAPGSGGFKIVNGTAYHKPGSQNTRRGN